MFKLFVMSIKISFEIKKFAAINKKNSSKKNLPCCVLFSDRSKIINLEKTINSLPKNSAIIIREYDLNIHDREIFAKKIIEIARPKGFRIIVGKDIALAKKIKADGVHFSDFDFLPIEFFNKKAFPKKFIFSFSCHSFKSFLKILKLKIDMVFISPIFPTTCHLGGSHLGASHLDTKDFGRRNLAKISLKTKNLNYSSSEIRPNIYALGGINLSNILSIRKLRLSGFGAISLFLK